MTELTTPGQLVRSLLDQRGWTQTVLATVTGLEQSTISRVAQDKRAIDAHLALLLAEAFDVEAEALLDAQKHYDLAKAREETHPDPRRTLRAQLYSRLPVGDMIKRGWIRADSLKDAARVEKELTRYFGVERPDDIEVLPHAAKKTDVGPDVSA